MAATQPKPPRASWIHLKRGPTKPTAGGTGLLYVALCGAEVYDSIAVDADCPDRWATCPWCLKHDPHPAFNRGGPHVDWSDR